MCDKLVSASASDTPFVSPTSLPKYRLSIAYFHIENSYLSIRYMYFRQAGVGAGSFYILCHSMRRIQQDNDNELANLRELAMIDETRDSVIQDSAE